MKYLKSFIRLKIRLKILTLLLAVNICNLSSQTDKYWTRYRFPYIYFDQKLWIGTPSGLYLYHADEDAFSVFGTHNGLSANDIRILQYDGEFLIVVTSKGVDFGDIKLNKWLNYSSSNGLPGDSIYNVAFQDDYIWVATDKGAARFDKLIQEWELFSTDQGLPDPRIYDIVVDNELVYFASAKGLAEYNVNFEKWRYYGQQEGITSDTIKFIYQTTDFLWLFTNDGPIRFNKKLHSTLSFVNDDRLKYSNINDLIINNNQFWLATKDGLLIYDPGANIWRNFQEEMNLPSPIVKTHYISYDKQWFVTEKGIAEFSVTSKTWQQYDRTHGLSDDNYESVTEAGGIVFLVNEKAIDYLKTSENENRWYNYTLKDHGDDSTRTEKSISFNKETGSYIKFGRDYKFSPSGSRYTFRHQREYTQYLNDKPGESTFENIIRGDLKGQLSMKKGRTINGFYNNVDYIDKELYGVRYKGNNEDIIQEINWGDIRYEQGKNEIIPSIGIFGTSGRFEYGPKTDRFKRSLFSAKAYSGEKTTRRETDFYTGNKKSGTSMVLDTNYLKNTCFFIEKQGLDFSVDKGSEKIFIDDKSDFTNTENTNINFIAGGEIGDFDYFHTGTDYFFDNESGIVNFNKPVSDSAIIVFLGTSNNTAFSQILRKPGVTNNVLFNRYSVGGIDILPYTFDLQIVDTLNNIQLLSDFGLDHDNDGKVDPQYIDYKNGTLNFPDNKPFPEVVYRDGNKENLYILKFNFETENSRFSLSHNNLLRGSEIVLVDGEILSPGKDYLLDYTAGTLTIIKEGIISEDSEIEVQYEYYYDSNEEFNLAGMSFNPSDNIQIEANYFQFSEQVDTITEKYQGYNILSEFRWKIKKIDFKVIPQMAYSEGNDKYGSSFHFRSEISSQKTRIFSEYEKVENDFKSLYKKEFQLGDINDKISLGGIFYPTEFLEVSTNWKKQDNNTKSYEQKFSEELLNGKVLFSKNYLPAISVSAGTRILDTMNFISDKKILKGDYEYKVPDKLIQALSLNSIRLYSALRRSWEDKDFADDTLQSMEMNKIYDNQYVRLDFSPATMVQINAYYRGSSVRKWNQENNSNNVVLNLNQKLNIDAIIDRIKGINMTIRFQGELHDYTPSALVNIHDHSLYRRLQTNLRFYPGRWFPAFNPFTFELGYNPEWNGYLSNVSEDLNFAQKYWVTSFNNLLKSSVNNKMYQFRCEWRPSSTIVLFSVLEYYNRKNQNLSSINNTDIYKIFPKLEIKPNLNSLLTLQYSFNKEDMDGYLNTIIHNPLILLENRWNEKLQTKMNITYWEKKRNILRISDETKILSPLIGITYRFVKPGRKNPLGEIRDDISISINRNRIPSFKNYRNSYYNSFAIDIFPTSVLIIRLRLITTYTDILYSDYDEFITEFEVRLTAQF